MVATNIVGTARLLDAAVEAGVKAFIHSGSSSEYGLKNTAAREDDRLEPNSDYAVTKGAATHYCRHVAVSRDFNAITLRLYSIYGPWEAPTRLVPVLLTHALRGEWPPLTPPSTARDFVYVGDAVEAMLAVAAAPSVPRGAIYNVCLRSADNAGRRSSIRFAICWRSRRSRAGRRWRRETGIPIAGWDRRTRIAQAVGWRATTPLREGLSRTLAWMRAPT